MNNLRYYLHSPIPVATLIAGFTLAAVDATQTWVALTSAGMFTENNPAAATVLAHTNLLTMVLVGIAATLTLTAATATSLPWPIKACGYLFLAGKLLVVASNFYQLGQ